MRIVYLVTEIDGDYAVLRTPAGVENRVAMALLPEGIDIGTSLLFEDFEYSVIEP